MEALTKTTSESPILLSNAEVLELLGKRIETREKQQQSQRRRRNQSTKFQHRDWIEEHVHAYLKTTPCASLEAKRTDDLKSKLMATKKQQIEVSRRENGDGGGSSTSTSVITGFGLTEAEAIQVLNFMPREPVEIHLMIEELHGRLSEKRQEELLELIGSYTQNEKTDRAGKKNLEEMEVEEVIEEGLDPVKREV